MEVNQITCPQCGLANNELAESCVQCGIIFIKKPVMKTHAIKDDQKRKAIEEAEAILEDIQAPPEIDALEADMIKRPDSREDTLEIQIPKEETTDMKPAAALPEAPIPEAGKNSKNQEIEMEAIEAAMETVDAMLDAEALFLSEVNADKSAETANLESALKAVGTPSEPEKADHPRGETLKPKADEEDCQNRKFEALPVDPLEDNPMAETQMEENRLEKQPEQTKSETAEAAEAETAVAEVVEPENAEDHLILTDEIPPAEHKIQLEEKSESTEVEAATVRAEAPPYVNAKIEMPEELVETNARANEQAEKTKQDALKKQREAQAKAEALEKEKAAKVQAVALKKKKLIRAQALKKQKAAQARAEASKKKKETQAQAQVSKNQEAAQARADALKKQKAAQAKAEASSQEIQCAGNAMPQAAAASMTRYERLLGLLIRYKGKAIGINYDNSSEIREAELVDANEEFFSVRVKDKKLQYSYPLKTILTIVEGQEGVETGEGDKKAKFDAVIKVYPLVLS